MSNPPAEPLATAFARPTHEWLCWWKITSPHKDGSPTAKTFKRLGLLPRESSSSRLTVSTAIQYPVACVKMRLRRLHFRQDLFPGQAAQQAFTRAEQIAQGSNYARFSPSLRDTLQLLPRRMRVVLHRQKLEQSSNESN